MMQYGGNDSSDDEVTSSSVGNDKPNGTAAIAHKGRGARSFFSRFREHMITPPKQIFEGHALSSLTSQNNLIRWCSIVLSNGFYSALIFVKFCLRQHIYIP
jgi:hypothetical protein